MEVITLASRPELAPRIWEFPHAWDKFIDESPMGKLYNADCLTAYPEFIMLALDGEDVVARSFSVPIAWSGEPGVELPACGWDWAVRRATVTRFESAPRNLVSALEVTVQVSRRGMGLAAIMLDAMRQNVADQGFTDLVAPVRPSGKHRYPDEPMSVYSRRTRADGLPEDPWLRVHVRAGGQIVNLAPLSMTIAGTLVQWRDWTGLPFDTAGRVYVPGALVPVLCDPSHDYAVYVEPNVWVWHQLRRPMPARL